MPRTRDEVEALVRGAFPQILDGTLVDVVNDWGGYGMCTYATRDLIKALGLNYLESHVWLCLEVRYGGPPRPGRFRIPDAYPQVEAPMGEHCIALIDGWVVDLTAQQYDESLPFPYIWRPDWISE